jgi:drug/metabolite transporter (DMT)-like permease
LTGRSGPPGSAGRSGPGSGQRADLLRGVLLLGLIWGASVVLQRLAVAEIPPVSLVTIRVMAGLAFFLPLLARVGGLSLGSRRQAFDCLLIGVFNPGISGALSGLALQFASSGVFAVLTALSPVFTALLARVVLREPPLRADQLAGLSAAFGGVLLLIATGSSGLGAGSDGDLRGQLLALVIALSMAVTTIYARQRLGAVDPRQAAALQMIGALVAVGPVGLLTGPTWSIAQVSPAAWLAVLLSGTIGLSLSFVIYLGMIARHGPTAATLVLYVMPVVATLLGALFLGESITLPMLTGAGLVLAGVYLFTRRRARRL